MEQKIKYLCVVFVSSVIVLVSCFQCEKTVPGYQDFVYGYCQSGCCFPRTAIPCCESVQPYRLRQSDTKLSVGAIVGIVIGGAVSIAICCLFLCCCVYKRQKGEWPCAKFN